MFNGRDGEWLGVILALNKKDATIRIESNLRLQSIEKKQVSLYFAPIKKVRLSIMIEKATEIGVSDFYPVITARTENRKLNTGRMESQIIEAAEQSERLSVPRLHAVQPVDRILQQTNSTPLFACVERADLPLPSISTFDFSCDAGFLIGPEGGFTPDELRAIAQAPHVKAISLGENILRAETAAILCLSHACL